MKFMNTRDTIANACGYGFMDRSPILFDFGA